VWRWGEGELIGRDQNGCPKGGGKKRGGQVPTPLVLLPARLGGSRIENETGVGGGERRERGKGKRRSNSADIPLQNEKTRNSAQGGGKEKVGVFHLFSKPAHKAGNEPSRRCEKREKEERKKT